VSINDIWRRRGWGTHILLLREKENTMRKGRKGTMMVALVALVALGVVAVAGIAYAITSDLGPGNNRFREKNAQGCQNDDVSGGTGKDRLYFNTSNETNCPNGDVDFGHGQEGDEDLVDVSDPDTMDTAGGGPGTGDTCIITVDQHGTADVADDSRDVAGAECEVVTEVIYNPQP